MDVDEALAVIQDLQRQNENDIDDAMAVLMELDPEAGHTALTDKIQTIPDSQISRSSRIRQARH